MNTAVHMCHVMFSWLGMFACVLVRWSWTSSLEGLGKCLVAVGFVVSMGSVCLWVCSGFGDVRHVYFHSLFKVALLAYFHCFQLLTIWITKVFLLPFPPCTVGQHLLSRASVDLFLGSPNLLCVAETCGCFLNTLSCPLHNSSCVHLSWLIGPPLCCRACVFFQLPQAHPLCHKSFVLERFVWRPLGTLGPPSSLQVLWADLGSELTIWSAHSLWAVHGLRSAAFSIFWASESLFGPVFQDYEAPPWFHLWVESPSAQGILLFQGLVSSSGHKLPSKSSQSFPFLCLHPLLPHFRSLSYPLKVWGLLLEPRGCFVEVVMYLEFLMYLWEADNLPPYSSTIFFHLSQRKYYSTV